MSKVTRRQENGVKQEKVQPCMIAERARWTEWPNFVPMSSDLPMHILENNGVLNVTVTGEWLD